MTKVIFKDGTELNAENIISRTTSYNGTQRDSLLFLFPNIVPFQTMVDTFVPENCTSIILEDESGERYTHEGYSIPVSYGVQERGKLLNFGTLEDEDSPDHRMVAFAQMVRTTKSERELTDIKDAVETLIVASLEV